MVEKFRYRPDYPSRYPRQWDFKQSEVPSQYMPVPPPFDPREQPDHVRKPPPGVIDWGIVRANFDSRLPGGFDFYWQLFFQNGADLVGGFTIPVGFVLILRNLDLTVWPLQTGDNLHPTINVDQYGFSNNSANLSIQLDGVPVSTWTPGLGSVAINDIFSGTINIPTFILGGEGQNLNISIPGVTSLASSSEMTVIAHLYGNLLQSTGRRLYNEVGNADPDPVREY